MVDSADQGDVLRWLALNDMLFGGSGNDTLDGGVGADVMLGGAGDDTYVVDYAGDAIAEIADEGTDDRQCIGTVTASWRTSSWWAAPICKATATPRTTRLPAMTATTSSTAALGPTSCTAAGNDAFRRQSGDQVIENPGEGNDTVYSTTHFRLSADVDNLILLGSADLQAYGNSLSNPLYGGTGSDILDGGGGADAMFGGQGNDAYFVDNPADVGV